LSPHFRYDSSLLLLALALAVASAEGSSSTFAGARSCAECHRGTTERWHDGRHSKMLQPATTSTVLGDFARRRTVLRGQTYELAAREGGFWITESALTGRPRTHRVDYTLGSRRIQHYLTRRDDGSIVVLPPTWDVTRREWFPSVEIVRPDEADKTPIQVWNKTCLECHVSGQTKAFDSKRLTYATSWQDTGTSCERCHGPGVAHVERERARVKGGEKAAASAAAGDDVLSPYRLDATKSTTLCAQCHTLRDVVAPGFTAGRDYYDHFMPMLEYGPRADHDPAWWADGRPRRFSNDALGFWESQCFLKGKASCTTCHLDPHLPDVDKDATLADGQTAICLQCHQAIGRDVPSHTRHRPESAASSCVECHMPRHVLSIKARIRDHAIGVPAPETTARFGIPNACNDCHVDRTPEWAEDQLAKWFPENRRHRVTARAEAFTLAREENKEGIPKLLAIASSPAEPPLLRANALGHLGRFLDPRAVDALRTAARDEEPILRAVAVMNLEPAKLGETERAKTTEALAAALADPRRVVRAGAALSLVRSGITRLAGDSGRLFEAAKRDYVERARLHPDDAQTQLELGQFLLLDAQFASAAEAFDLSRRLDPRQPLEYFFALVDYGQGRIDEARRRLDALPPGDPHAAAARRLRERLQASQP
jgi:predicted CXXCH cytochrome family protein